MASVVFGDPAWFATLPHRVSPKAGEALVSLLLRCDEMNGWASGALRTYLKNVLHDPVELPDLVVPSPPQVEVLAQWLSLPPGTIAATTYLWELMRFFEPATPEPGDLCPWFVFRLCPVCIKEHRVLLRCHFLLGVTACQQHQLSLLSSCSCGAALQPFGPRTSPFTCPTCEKDWGDLPYLQAEASDLEKERLILACYEWWLSYGDQARLSDILLLLMHLDVVSERPDRAARASSRWSDGSPRTRVHLRSSRMGPLSGLVRGLDEKDLLSHYAEKE